MKNHKILIIGGGTGGIMTASRFLKLDSKLDIGLIEPAEYHYYQPAWTLVGAGTYDWEKTKRTMASVMPSGVNWIKDYAVNIDAKNNTVTTKDGSQYGYEYLVVSPGLVMDLSLIEGLTESLGKGVVCSNYTDPNHVWQVLSNFKGGNAIFTQPTTPIKCGGAPQKIAYLAADYFRKHNLADKTNTMFATPGSVIFGVEVVKNTLEKVMERYNMQFKPFYAPVKIDGEKRIVTFKCVAPEGQKCIVEEGNAFNATQDENGMITMPFSMLHLAPPQVAPKFIRESDLVNAEKWLDVDINTLQHNKYPNVFGIGDVAALPTAKTGAAIRKQMPIVVDSIMRMMAGQPISTKRYNGYSSCPLVTAYGKMVLAEFDYEMNFTPDPELKKMLVFHSEKEHWRLWILKKYILPYLYWNKMMKGKEV